MKLRILSDLHLDVNRRFAFTLPEPRPEHDAIVIAGDICQGIREGVRFIADAGLDAKPVLCVAGNHDLRPRPPPRADGGARRGRRAPQYSSVGAG
jgi:3',5'-cyclic AMP phosphodiesterase CpdA